VNTIAINLCYIISFSLHKHALINRLSILQEEGEKKDGEEQKEEHENLGKLEFSLDYNFTDAQVHS